MITHFPRAGALSRRTAVCHAVAVAASALAALAVIFTIFAPALSLAQDTYPDKPIRLVVPFPAGGGTDTLARSMTPIMAQVLGQPIVVENRPGACGNVGSELVARSAPNGYTLLFGHNGTFGINHGLYTRTGFDPIKDFAPIGRIGRVGVVLAVHPSIKLQGFDAFAAPYDLFRTIAREFDMALATIRLCAGGVLEEFPHLKVIVAHFGGGFSSIKERMDRYIEFLSAKFWTGKPLSSAPYLDNYNKYFNRLYFNMAGREAGMQTIKCALTNISPNRLLFATGYPSNSIDDGKGLRTYIEKIRRMNLDKKSIDAMLGTNAIDLLGLEL